MTGREPGGTVPAATSEAVSPVHPRDVAAMEPASHPALQNRVVGVGEGRIGA